MAGKLFTEASAEDIARESLIAISNSSPDKIGASPEKTADCGKVVANGVEEYRYSGLITLSYTSPDATEPLPASLPQVKGICPSEKVRFCCLDTPEYIENKSYLHELLIVL